MAIKQRSKLLWHSIVRVAFDMDPYSEACYNPYTTRDYNQGAYLLANHKWGPLFLLTEFWPCFGGLNSAQKKRTKQTGHRFQVLQNLQISSHHCIRPDMCRWYWRSSIPRFQGSQWRRNFWRWDHPSILNGGAPLGNRGFNDVLVVVESVVGT